MTTLTAAERIDAAKALGMNQQYLYQCLTGRRMMDPKQAVRVEQYFGGRVRRWHLRPQDWHEVWPELVASEGAPPPPGEPAQQAA